MARRRRRRRRWRTRLRRRRRRRQQRRRAGLGSGSAGGRADMAANMYRVGGRKARPDPARLGAGSGSGGSGRVHPNRWEPRAPGLRAQGVGGAGARRGGRGSPPYTLPFLYPLPPPWLVRGLGPPPPPAQCFRAGPVLGGVNYQTPPPRTPMGVWAVEPPNRVVFPRVPSRMWGLEGGGHPPSSTSLQWGGGGGDGGPAGVTAGQAC